MKKPIKIIIIADHGGYAKANILCSRLRHSGYEIMSLLPQHRIAGDDFPVYVARAAAIMRTEPRAQLVMICRSGVGMAIAANRYPWLRAVQAVDLGIINRSRREENSNALSLAADFLTVPNMMKILKTWLGTSYRPLQRYQRRIKC